MDAFPSYEAALEQEWGFPASVQVEALDNLDLQGRRPSLEMPVAPIVPDMDRREMQAGVVDLPLAALDWQETPGVAGRMKVG